MTAAYGMLHWVPWVRTLYRVSHLVMIVLVVRPYGLFGTQIERCPQGLWLPVMRMI